MNDEKIKTIATETERYLVALERAADERMKNQTEYSQLVGAIDDFLILLKGMWGEP